MATMLIVDEAAEVTEAQWESLREYKAREADIVDRAKRKMSEILDGAFLKAMIEREMDIVEKILRDREPELSFAPSVSRRNNGHPSSPAKHKRKR